MIKTFHKDYQEKPIAILLPIYFALPMTKLIAQPIARLLNATKGKSSQPIKAFVKKASVK